MNLQERVNDFLAEGNLKHRYASTINHYYAQYLETLGINDTVFVDRTPHHLIDGEGRRVLDMVAGYGTCHWGRSEKVLDAARQALELRMPNLVQFSIPVLATMVAEELLAYAGGAFQRVFFTNGGAESIDYTLKMARNVTKKSRVVAFDDAYHGLTLGALSINGAKAHRRVFGLDGDNLMLPFNDVEAVEQAFREHKSEIGAVVVEPIVARTGAVATPEFLSAIRRACDRHGALMVLDEIKTGFGRTGRPFFFQWSGVIPDIITFAKGLSGGVSPVGGVLYTESVYGKVFKNIERIAVYSSTFKENNVAMAVALQVLQLYRENPGIYDHVLAAEQRLRDRLEAAGDGARRFKVGGKGLLLTIEVDPVGGRRILHAVIDRVEGDMFYGMLAKELYVDEEVLVSLPNRFGAKLALIPALDLPLEEFDRFADALVRTTDRLLAMTNWKLLKAAVADARAVL